MSLINQPRDVIFKILSFTAEFKDDDSKIAMLTVRSLIVTSKMFDYLKHCVYGYNFISHSATNNKIMNYKLCNYRDIAYILMKIGVYMDNSFMILHHHYEVSNIYVSVEPMRFVNNTRDIQFSSNKKYIINGQHYDHPIFECLCMATIKINRLFKNNNINPQADILFISDGIVQ